MTTSDVPAALGGWRAYDAIKRAVDVVVSAGIVAVTLPLWIAIGIAIRATSRGPIFFRQTEAVGRHGQKFTLYKFRTMRSDASDAMHREAIDKFVAGQSLASDDEQLTVYKIVRDPRVTPIGRILRKTGLDELPQFINVLRGEMSIVGPRPSVAYEYELYNDYQKLRLSVVPGITGLYQVTARSHVPLDLMVEIDLDYIKRRSICLDLQIMIRTVWVMLTGRGAY
jgi:lipopolysaccharide/colanic/teichoic acid biosynthesis glycosyltransferase